MAVLDTMERACRDGDHRRQDPGGPRGSRRRAGCDSGATAKKSTATSCFALAAWRAILGAGFDGQEMRASQASRTTATMKVQFLASRPAWCDELSRICDGHLDKRMKRTGVFTGSSLSTAATMTTGNPAERRCQERGALSRRDAKATGGLKGKELFCIRIACDCMTIPFKLS